MNPHVREERGQAVEMSEEDLYSGVIRPNAKSNEKKKTEVTFI